MDDQGKGAQQAARFEDYPFPLSDGGMAILRLPVPLHAEDADRLCALIATLPTAPPRGAPGVSRG